MFEKSAIEKLGVRISDHAKNITIDGKSYADLVLFEYLRTENLRRCLAALNLVGPHGENETLVEVQAQLQVMAKASSGVLQEHLRLAREQGLRFEIAPTACDIH